MCVTLFSKCLFSSLSYDMANLVNMTTVSEYINEWRKNLLHFLNNWYTPLTFALDSLIRTLQWVILLSLSLMKIEEYAISFSYSLWFPEHCSAELFNNRSQDNTSPCAFTSLVLLSQPQPTPPPPGLLCPSVRDLSSSFSPQLPLKACCLSCLWYSQCFRSQPFSMVSALFPLRSSHPWVKSFSSFHFAPLQDSFSTNLEFPSSFLLVKYSLPSQFLTLVLSTQILAFTTTLRGCISAFTDIFEDSFDFS